MLQQQVRQGEDRVHRRSEFMAHVGEEARFHFVCAPQMPRLLIQLGIECDHATIGVFQFTVETDQLLLTLVQFLQGSEQFLVLLSDLFDGILGFVLPQLFDDFLEGLARKERRSRGKDLRQSYHALFGHIRSDLALIH